MSKQKTSEPTEKNAVFKCVKCDTTFTVSRLLNPHIIASIAGETYDQTLVTGIEGDARDEALKEKPNWFIWLIVGVVPYAFITLFAVLSMLGAK